jgi:hypothetical protein
MKPPEAMVLAAGKGSRLFPLTNDDSGISRKSRRDFTRIHPGFIAICSNRAIGGRSGRRLRRSGR